MGSPSKNPAGLRAQEKLAIVGHLDLTIGPILAPSSDEVDGVDACNQLKNGLWYLQMIELVGNQGIYIQLLILQQLTIVCGRYICNGAYKATNMYPHDSMLEGSQPVSIQSQVCRESHKKRGKIWIPFKSYNANLQVQVLSKTRYPSLFHDVSTQMQAYTSMFLDSIFAFKHTSCPPCYPSRGSSQKHLPARFMAVIH